jgi:hypothetical protein
MALANTKLQQVTVLLYSCGMVTILDSTEVTGTLLTAPELECYPDAGLQAARAHMIACAELCFGESCFQHKYPIVALSAFQDSARARNYTPIPTVDHRGPRDPSKRGYRWARTGRALRRSARYLRHGNPNWTSVLNVRHDARPARAARRNCHETTIPSETPSNNAAVEATNWYGWARA